MKSYPVSAAKLAWQRRARSSIDDSNRILLHFNMPLRPQVTDVLLIGELTRRTKMWGALSLV